MTLKDRIAAFSKLGDVLHSYVNGKSGEFDTLLEASIVKAKKENPWFTDISIKGAMQGISILLNNTNLEKWVSKYSFDDQSKSIACILAGNIPMVGFHDLLCVLISGNTFIGKMSSKDNYLLPALVEILDSIEPRFKEKVVFVDNLKNLSFDAVIATGSNNSARYFEQYFGHLPHIIRKGRSSVGILSGKENEQQLQGLADDIFMYYGLGCRNISKLYIPQDFDIRTIFPFFDKYITYQHHHKWMNNFNYNRSINLINQDKFYETEFALYKKDTALISPITVVYYEEYRSVNDVIALLDMNKEQIQCVVSSFESEKFIPLGRAQYPEVDDYADNIDTLEFLSQL